MSNIKEVTFGLDAREKILSGVNTVADAVRITMGAKGRNALIETQGGLPKITKDGVSVARSIFLEEPLESLGAEMIKQAAEKTVEDCGDSTTNTVVLASELMNLAEQEVKKGAHPILLKNGISDAVNDVTEELKKRSVKLKKRDYNSVARISANNDKELGDMIAKAFKLAGKNGVVTYERSVDEVTSVKNSKGLKIERGLYNQYMVTDKKKNRMDLENPYVFVCNKKIESIEQIMPLITKSRQDDVWVLVIGEMEKSAANLLTANLIKHKLKIRLLDAPSFGSKRADLMEDIAIATGATLVKNEGTDNIASVCVNYLGTAKGFTCADKESFLDIDNEKYQEQIDSQVSLLSEQRKNLKKSIASSFIDERIAKLSCSVATVQVGAISDVELDEKIDRVDDAISATKSAIEEGILVGGGLALFNASYKLSYDKTKDKDYKLGYMITINAIRKPIRQILQNAGVDAESVISEIENSDNENLGYDVLSGKLVDLVDKGIIDPHKVIRCALQNAASVAQTHLLTDVAINIKRA